MLIPIERWIDPMWCGVLSTRVLATWKVGRVARRQCSTLFRQLLTWLCLAGWVFGGWASFLLLFLILSINVEFFTQPPNLGLGSYCPLRFLPRLDTLGTGE